VVAAVIIAAILIFSSSSKVDIDSLSEIEKYALFRADMTCRFADYGTSNMWQAMEEMEGLVEEYSYVPEDIQVLEATYAEDNDFWVLFMGHTKELCPEVYESMVPS